MEHARASSETSSGYAVELLHQSLNVERYPCGTALTFIRRQRAEIVMSDNGPPLAAVNT